MTCAGQSTLSMLVILLSVAISAPISAKDMSTTYRCHAKDAVSIMQDGTMNKLIGDVAKKDFDKIVIDVASGHITFPYSAQRKEWIVERAGLDDSEYILYPKSSRQRGHTTANAMTNFVRLRASKTDPQPRYVFVTLSYIVTGTCEPLP